MQPRDLERPRHMRDAAREALSFVAGRNRQALDTDRVLALALVKLLEIIGEAASALSAESRVKHGAIPWRDMVAMGTGSSTATSRSTSTSSGKPSHWSCPIC